MQTRRRMRTREERKERMEGERMVPRGEKAGVVMVMRMMTLVESEKVRRRRTSGGLECSSRGAVGCVGSGGDGVRAVFVFVFCLCHVVLFCCASEGAVGRWP
jgi:hypothetical protein